MMNYANAYYQPYQGNMMNPYPNHFVQAMQQNYGQPQQQQQITTQPPIMTPQNNANKIIPVSNKEEATASPVDLVNGTPSFFYNKEKNEVYIKQFDVPTGKGIFKTFVEVQPMVDEQVPQINPYEQELRYIREGVEGLYRILSRPQEQPVIVKEVEDIEQPKKKKDSK